MTLNDYSVWARNIINLRKNEKWEKEGAGWWEEGFGEYPLPEWTEEFRGSRADCLRYLAMALIDLSPDGYGHRNWTFAISPPGEAPGQPLEPSH